MDEEYKVSSELYEEYDYVTSIQPKDPNNVVSIFSYKDIPRSPKKDSDGDLDLVRKSANDYCNKIEIEHSKSTQLGLVGLQIWRGALLLADWLIYNGKTLPDGYILELGSGVGLTSIVASFYKPVICTDIDVGGLLDLIRNNIERNKTLNAVKVLELDFTAKFSEEIERILPEVQLVLAADVVYDDRLTEAFVKTVERLLSKPPKRTILIALEKRYVFTIADCETCAPCYEHFLDCLKDLKDISLEQLPTDFPQYFKYDRVQQLVLWKVSSTFQSAH